MMRVSNLRLLAKLISEAGLLEGGGAAFKKVASKINQQSKREPTTIKLKGYKEPIFLRISTSDWSTLEQIFIYREYAEPSSLHSKRLRNFYNRTVLQGMNPVIIDCGANIGLASVWFSSRFPHATIVAIEPEPNNFAVLCKNISRYHNIVPVKAAISSHEGRVSLHNASDAPWAWETVPNETGDTEAITIRNALSQIKDAVPLIAKIDIEGFETDLFQSNSDWVKEFPLIVFEQHDWLFAWRGTAHAIYRALTNFGPRDYLRRGENVFSYSHDLLKPSGACQGNAE
jgi:FkbM family methyltransferase